MQGHDAGASNHRPTAHKEPYLAAHHHPEDAPRRNHRGGRDPRHQRIGVFVPPSRHEGKVHVLKVHSSGTNDKVIDADHSATAAKPAPDSVGDQIAFNGRLFAGGKRVAREGGVCTLVELPSIYQCNATNWFKKGQLTVQFIGDFSSSEPGRFAITGGTGAYRGASGEVKYVGNPDGADVTFRFRTP